MKSLSNKILESYKSISQKELEKLTNYVDRLSVECDGASKIISLELYENDIDHKCFIGQVEMGDDGIPFHQWIEVGDFIIDYRLRMWLGSNSKIPHGVFKKSQKIVKYINKQEVDVNLKIARLLKATS